MRRTDRKMGVGHVTNKSKKTETQNKEIDQNTQNGTEGGHFN